MVHILCIHDRQKVQPNDITKICVQMRFFSTTVFHVLQDTYVIKTGI